MNIRITDRLLSVAEDKNNAFYQQAINALLLLEIANRLGRHFISVESISLFDRLSSLNLKIDTLCNLKASYTYDKQICQSFKWHTEIVDCEESYRDDDSGVIYLSLNDIPRFEVYSEVYVIGENLKDVCFFDHILNYYKETHKVDIETSFHKLLGGGSTTAVVFSQEQSLKQSFVICISDSDYRYKGSSLGDTAKSLELVYRPKNGPSSPFSYYYHYSAVSEVENLLPISLLQKYSSIKSNGLSENYNSIKKMVQYSPSSYYFFDLKDGITLRSFDKSNYNTSYYDWVRPIVPNIDDVVEADRDFIEKQYSSDDKIKKEEMKKKVYVKGFGNRILDNLLKTHSGYFVGEMHNSATLEQKQEYETIGEVLYNWCCRRSKIRL